MSHETPPAVRSEAAAPYAAAGPPRIAPRQALLARADRPHAMRNPFAID
ncbi:MAG: hypothetical protein OXF51_01545 [Alphaproteobacteria bacterium]|nr:hypothetical protein [Alphaproteobacteria bacterium]